MKRGTFSGGRAWRRATMADIGRLARRIALRFRPEKVILFGSYAYGRPARDSDVDLLVVMRTRRSKDDAV